MILYLYIVAFSFGLLLAVYAMLHGVERGGTSIPGWGVGEPLRTRLSLPAFAAAATMFGIAGALLVKFTTLSAPLHFVVAISVAVVSAFVARAMVSGWVAAAHEAPGEDPRFALMGHFAKVTEAITDAGGAVAYEVDGARYASKARTIVGQSIAVGADVVIERVEDGVAYVEPWTEVEQRI